MSRNNRSVGSGAASRRRQVQDKGKRSRSTHRGAVLSKFYGIQACRAIFRYRRNEISRVFISPDLVESFRELIEWSERHGIQYKAVGHKELSRIAATEHHEGICCEANAVEPLSISPFLSRLKGATHGCILILEGVENPHNVGAILRTGCFFGVSGVVLLSQQMKTLSGASCRVAEGAAETTPVAIADDSGALFKTLAKHGYVIIATTPHQAESMYTVAWPDKVALLFGSEGAGLSQRALESADLRVVIPRHGPLESLNVGAAVASVLTEVRRSSPNTSHVVTRQP